MSTDPATVGSLYTYCPVCLTVLSIEVTAWIEGEWGEQRLQTKGDMTDVWAHHFMHEENDDSSVHG